MSQVNLSNTHDGLVITGAPEGKSFLTAVIHLMALVRRLFSLLFIMLLSQHKDSEHQHSSGSCTELQQQNILFKSIAVTSVLDLASKLPSKT